MYDYEEGWDDPEFMVDLGFEVDLDGISFEQVFQIGTGTILFSNSNPFAGFIPISYDLADIGFSNPKTPSLIRWETTGEPGNQVFALEWANAGFYEEVFGGGGPENPSFVNIQMRIFEATGIIELHYGAISLTEDALADFEEEEWAGWHGLIPSYDQLYYEDIFILTNINTEQIYDNIDAVEQGIAFEGFPAEGRLFRYTPAVAGCHLEDACNYDETVNYPLPETCVFPASPGLDCEGNCIVDADADGNCDAIDGCTEGLACNYDPMANNDDGSCIISGCTNPAADNYDPAANNDDGSCIISGCTNPNAENYNPEANNDDGSCVATGCTYPGADNYDAVNTAEDGSCIFSGCTDATAENYIAYANNDDGSCVFEPCGTGSDCPFDANGDGEIGSADLLDFLVAFGQLCSNL